MEKEKVIWCICDIFQGLGRIYVENGLLPNCCERELPFAVQDCIEIGRLNDFPVFHARPLEGQILPPFIPFRGMLPVSDEYYYLISRALGINHLVSRQRFCPVCGTLCYMHDSEIAMSCPHCHSMQYPKISPCIIVAIHKGDEILLAQHAKHPQALYTVLAGFVEAGESFEQCVRREICEEVSISVRDIHYFGSQCWPFPSQIMAAFTCSYESGEITVDQDEILEAAWFHRDALPEMEPIKGSIAWKLIQNFKNKTGKIP